MKQFLALTFLLSIISIEALAFDAFVRHARFYAPESGPYIETYITIPTNQLKFVAAENDKIKAAVEITILYKNGNEIVKFDKYILNSKIFNNESEIDESLLDVKRTTLDAANYEIEVSFKDVNEKKGEELQTKSKVELSDLGNKIAMSDIQLLENYEKSTEENNFVKNGYMMVPHSINYYPTQMKKLMYYLEVYNTNTLNDDAYLISQSINYHNSDKVYKNIKQFSKKQPKATEAVLAEFDISKLPSGNFDLTIQVRNKANELVLEKKQLIQRLNLDYVESEDDLVDIQTNNTFANELSDEEALYQIRTLYPISSRSEVRLATSIYKDEKADLARQFLLNFFTKRNGANPGEPYENYMNAVTAVNNTFQSMLEEGFETEIGRVYLQYGEPSNMIKDQVKSGFEYQLWQYNTLPDGQTNISFLFTNLGIDDQSGGAYTIYHSDAKGEQKFSSWADAKQGLINGSKPFDTRSGNALNNFGNDGSLDELFENLGTSSKVRSDSDNEGLLGNPFE